MVRRRKVERRKGIYNKTGHKRANQRRCHPPEAGQVDVPRKSQESTGPEIQGPQVRSWFKEGKEDSQASEEESVDGEGKGPEKVPKTASRKGTRP